MNIGINVYLMETHWNTLYLTFVPIDTERWFAPILKDNFKPDLIRLFLTHFLKFQKVIMGEKALQTVNRST